jgi:hypothetical protein
MNIAAAGSLVEAKDFSTDRRKTLAKKGFAKPDGSYPIEDEQDVHNAVSDFHRASGSPSDKAHIRTRAKALGMGDPFGDKDVAAGGPGSGRHSEGGSYHDHALKFFDKMGEAGKKLKQGFVEHMKNREGLWTTP